MKVKEIRMLWEPYPVESTDRFLIRGQLLRQGEVVATLEELVNLPFGYGAGFYPDIVMYQLIPEVNADYIVIEVNDLNDHHTLMVNDKKFVIDFGDYFRPTRGTWEQYELALPVTPTVAPFSWQIPVIVGAVAVGVILIARKKR